MEKFELPGDAYPEEFPLIEDAEIPEFTSQSADLLRYVNGATSADYSKLEAMGIERIIAALLEISDGSQYSALLLLPPKNTLVAALYETVKSMNKGIHAGKHKIWTEDVLKFLVVIGFQPDVITVEMRKNTSFPAEIQRHFNAAAERIGLPRIFTQEDV